MELQELTQFIKRKWQTMALFVLVFTMLAFVFSVAQTDKYRSEQRFLIVSGYAEDVDPYAATRSTEYLSNLLSEVVYSQRFMNDVMDTGYAIDKSIFPDTAKKRKKEWKKTISTRVIGDTGMIDVVVYNKERFTTEQLALAVGNVLQSTHTDYHSRGGAVTIQTIDQPITSLRPVQPNIPLNTGAGAVLGLVAGLSFIYLFPRKEVSLTIAESHRLVDATEPDWSQPIAVPTSAPALTYAEADYEPAVMKYPVTSKEAQTDEIGYQMPEAPDNLPVA